MSNTAWQQKSRMGYLADGDTSIIDPEEEEQVPVEEAAPSLPPGSFFGQQPAAAEDPFLQQAGTDYMNAGVEPPPQGPGQGPMAAPTPISTAPSDRYSQAMDRLEAKIAQQPVAKKPNWLERIAAGAAGGAAGWSNAASRTKHPIDIASMQNNILHPGQADAMTAWQSQIAPLKAQVDIEGQRQTAQQNIAKTQAQIDRDKAYAGFENNQLVTVTPEMETASNGRLKTGTKVPASVVNTLDRMVDVTPEMEESSDGRFKAGTKIPAQVASTIERKSIVTQAMSDASGGLYPPGARISASEGKALIDAALKRPAAEKTMAVTDPNLAHRLGVEVGTQVPYSIYQAGITANSREDSEAGLRFRAAQGDPAAIKAIKSLDDEMARRAKASRPDASTININSVDPAALNQAADLYSTTGQMPALGMGKDAASLRMEIMKRAAERHPDADLASNRTDYNANKSSIADITKNQSRVLTSEGTAAKNLDLAARVSAQVDRTGSPLVNHYLLYLKGQVAGDDNTQLLNNAVETAANEYANVVTAGSGGGVAATDSARQHAREMLNSAMANGTFQKVVAQMKVEMANRRQSLDDQLKNLKSGRTNAQPSSSLPQPGAVINPTQHYVPGHIYGGKTFVGPGIDQGVDNSANWK